MTNYEHTIIEIDMSAPELWKDRAEALFDNMSKNGWELVTIANLHYAVFRRHISERYK